MGFRISRWYGPRHSLMYEARVSDGEHGIGTTPMKAILDLRHLYRHERDAAEVGKCRQGRFHTD